MAPTVIQLRSDTCRPTRPSKAARLGSLVATLASLARPRRRPITSEDLRRHDTSICTQRLGVRFTERLRDAFRSRWLRRHL
ncbi:MAG: hypothetical protein RBR19_10045 [Sedimentisphaerales bacterium]|nr:hypothetical protein [Sedimentisphaerales bacterium]NLT77519.1 hypothetical protein [Planctomycetota bacterium]